MTAGPVQMQTAKLSMFVFALLKSNAGCGGLAQLTRGSPQDSSTKSLKVTGPNTKR